MKKLLLLLFIMSVTCSYAKQDNEKIVVSKDLEIVKICDNVYVHISYTYSAQWGKLGSNGVIYTNNGEAVLFDTPMTESATIELVEWIQNVLKVKITSFIPNHWHADCIGGLAYLHKLGIKSYANEMTIKIAKENKLTAPSFGFKDSLTIRPGNKEIFCFYPGAAHSMDNIVVWLPAEKILFAGCMAKELSASNLGNTADGDLKEYPVTINKVLNKFGNAKIVIPGHGKYGGIELLRHTLEMAEK
jgi:metallo-beta-lactamase class B